MTDWPTAASEAEDWLTGMFTEPPENPRQLDAFEVARRVFLLTSGLVKLGDVPVDERERLQQNISRLQALALALHERMPVDEDDLNGARFVLTCFKPGAEPAAAVLTAARLALTAMLVTVDSVLFEEMWQFHGPEGWCLAWHAFDTLTLAAADDPEDCEFEVVPDEAVIGLMAARQIDAAVRQAGGGDTMSPN